MRETIITSGGLESFKLYEKQGHDYKRHQRVGWLSDVLWWTLSKLGCVPEHMATVQQWRFAGKSSKPKLLEAIHDAVDIEMIYRKPDEYAVVMGIEDCGVSWHEREDSHVSLSRPQLRKCP